MTENLEQAAAALERARAALERAQQTYERQRPTLFASDGKTPILPPENHQQRLYELRRPVELAAEEARAAAAAAIDAANVERLDVLYACPTRELSANDLAAANALAVFIREECQRQPMSDLAERLRWAGSAKGDAARRFLYLRYSRERWQAESAKETPGSGVADLGAALRDLDNTRSLSERRRDLDDRLTAVNTAAFQLRARAANAMADGQPQGHRLTL